MGNNENQVNVLVTSISKKVPLLKVVKNSIERISPRSKIYGGDADPYCIGRFFVDEYWEMKKIDDLQIEEVVEYCKKQRIIFIIPTRDEELLYFASHKHHLEINGINAMVSPYEAINNCIDKFKFFEVLSNDKFPSILTSEQVNDIKTTSNLVVKERYGAGSKAVGLMLSKCEAEKYSKFLNNPIFQPFVKGVEVSIDLYMDKGGKPKGIISRTRDKVVGGESQITTTRRIPNLEKLCSIIAGNLNLYGHVVFQAIIDQDGRYHIIECNSRFGGASTLSVAAGLDSFYWFFLESLGEDLKNYPFVRTAKELTMVRHPNDLIF